MTEFSGSASAPCEPSRRRVAWLVGDRKTITVGQLWRTRVRDASHATYNYRVAGGARGDHDEHGHGSLLASNQPGMSRPPPPHRDRNAPPPAHSPTSDDITSSFGGLAGVLEPDPDAITSLRRLGAASVTGRAGRAAGPRRTAPPSLRGGNGPPISARAPAPIQLQDFAFADTVVAQELGDDERPPPSGPIYVSDSLGNTQCLTPLAFPLPAAAEDVDLRTRLRIALSHVRHATRGSVDEMRELWAGTAQMVEGGASAGRFHRALAMWSCFQWSGADLTRAAMIGLAVFLTAGAIGATTLDLGDGTASAASHDASSAEVRGARTLDQHTGKKSVVHAKR